MAGYETNIFSSIIAVHMTLSASIPLFIVVCSSLVSQILTDCFFLITSSILSASIPLFIVVCSSLVSQIFTDCFFF